MDNEQMELSDKMSAMHRGMYKRMLGLNELPIFLLKRYFSIKKLLDKIDGFMSVGDLVRIALDCGFNPDTMRFDGHISAKIPLKALAGVAKDKPAAKPEKEPEPEPEKAVVETEEKTADKEVDEKEAVEEKPEIYVGSIPLDETVKILYAGNIIEGTVEGCKEEEGNLIYSVDTDEGILEVSQEDIEVS